MLVLATEASASDLSIGMRERKRQRDPVFQVPAAGVPLGSMAAMEEETVGAAAVEERTSETEAGPQERLEEKN